MEALSRRDYSRLWNTNDALLSAICFLHLPSILFLPLFPPPSISLSLFLFHSFCHQMSNFLSILPSKLVILSLTPPHLGPLTVSNTAYSHTIKHIRKDTQHTHTSVLSSPLLSPRLTCSLVHSLSRIFQWWLLSLSSPQKQRILVHTGQRGGEGWRAGHRGRDPNLEWSSNKSCWKCGNPSVLLSAGGIFALAQLTLVFLPSKETFDENEIVNRHFGFYYSLL